MVHQISSARGEGARCDTAPRVPLTLALSCGWLRYNSAMSGATILNSAALRLRVAITCCSRGLDFVRSRLQMVAKRRHAGSCRRAYGSLHPRIMAARGRWYTAAGARAVGARSAKTSRMSYIWPSSRRCGRIARWMTTDGRELDAPSQAEYGAATYRSADSNRQ